MECSIVYYEISLLELCCLEEPIDKSMDCTKFTDIRSLTMCRCGSDIAKSTLEALSGMAIDLFRNRQQKNALTERLSTALKSMLKVS